MPEQPDYPAEYAALRVFLPEPGGKPPESTKSLAARVECLERALDCSSSEIESLKSELATLVSTVDDIGQNARRHTAWAPRPVVSSARSRFVTATVGVVFGVALGVLGWALWSRNASDTTDTIDTVETTVVAPEPVAERVPLEVPLESPSSTEARVSLAAATEPVAEPQPTIAQQRPVQARVDYVGTLSIDAAPGGEVFIDRVAAGQTPLRIQNLKAGSHLVWIEREGYRRFTRVVQVPADRVSRVWAELEPIPER